MVMPGDNVDMECTLITPIAMDEKLRFAILQADDLDGIGNLNHTALNTAGRNGAAAGDGEHVLNRHQERLVGVALRGRDVLIDSVHQLEDALALRRILRIGAAVLDILQSLQRGTADDRDLVAREAVGAQQLADLHLDQPAGCAHGSAASGRPEQTRPGSRRPSGQRR